MMMNVNNNEVKVNEEDEEDEEAVHNRINRPMTLHPLRYTWVFWHYRRSKRTNNNSNNNNKNWMDCQRALAELDTLESFWHFFVQLQSPSIARINQDYALFKHGIEPMWEDPHNVNGGQWIFVIQKSHPNYRYLVDNVWDEIVLALICSIFSPSIMDLICGVVFSMRISCFTKISVWLSDYRAVKELLILGHELKRLTNFDDCIIFRRNGDMKVKFIL
ncbi:hypothetical protein RDWZM_002186 [Blomia tropicalis]|uniref:Uncharacterized protein n=1 Tax=Blomia tropicalis TaxID=40697 RepID=A0A9Q0RRD3_BLOTA|nr:hypothetical protein RDWZM_002186 [Blomia tropicalis]